MCNLVELVLASGEEQPDPIGCIVSSSHLIHAQACLALCHAVKAAV